MKYIALCSFGKDSLAMILNLIEKKYPLDIVIFYDTGMEFQAIYNTRDRVVPILEENGIEYIELHSENTFEYDMFDRPIKNIKTREIHKYGYSWCGRMNRWGTALKRDTMKKYYRENLNCEETYEYIGIAIDEAGRLPEDGTFKIVSNNKTIAYPLAEWNMTEKDCLNYCYSKGYKWEEFEPVTNTTIRLYDILPRVSCWCCKNKNISELRNYYHNLPSYWNRLKDIQSKLNEPMKGEGKSVFDLEQRYMLEDKWLSEGKNNIRSKAFFAELKNIIKERKYK